MIFSDHSLRLCPVPFCHALREVFPKREGAVGRLLASQVIHHWHHAASPSTYVSMCCFTVLKNIVDKQRFCMYLLFIKLICGLGILVENINFMIPYNYGTFFNYIFPKYVCMFLLYCTTFQFITQNAKNDTFCGTILYDSVVNLTRQCFVRGDVFF